MMSAIRAGVLALAALAMTIPASANVIADQSLLTSCTLELPWHPTRTVHPAGL